MNGLKKFVIKVSNYTLYDENGLALEEKELDAILSGNGQNYFIPYGPNMFWVPSPYVTVVKEITDIKDISGQATGSLCALIGSIPKNLTINF